MRDGGTDLLYILTLRLSATTESDVKKTKRKKHGREATRRQRWLVRDGEKSSSERLVKVSARGDEDLDVCVAWWKSASGR
jgi:hypothetical protein